MRLAQGDYMLDIGLPQALVSLACVLAPNAAHALRYGRLQGLGVSVILVPIVGGAATLWPDFQAQPCFGMEGGRQEKQDQHGSYVGYGKHSTHLADSWHSRKQIVQREPNSCQTGDSPAGCWLYYSGPDADNWNPDLFDSHMDVFGKPTRLITKVCFSLPWSVRILNSRPLAICWRSFFRTGRFSARPPLAIKVLGYSPCHDMTAL